MHLASNQETLSDIAAVSETVSALRPGACSQSYAARWHFIMLYVPANGIEAKPLK